MQEARSRLTTRAAKKNADKSVTAGREYVEAYVNYVHYVEGIHAALMSKGEHHAEGNEGAKTGHEVLNSGNLIEK